MGNALRTKPNLFQRIWPPSQISANRKNKESEVAYHKAIEINPRFTRAWINLGVLFYQDNRYLEAETSYLEALKYEPESLLALYNLGTLYDVTNKFDEARNYYKAVLEIAPIDCDLRKITQKKLLIVNQQKVSKYRIATFAHL